MRERLRRVIPLVLLVGAIAVGAWWWNGRSSDGGDRTVSGTIEATEVTLAAETMGRVTAVNAAEGDAVTAGQKLVIFDPALLEKQRAQTEAGLIAAQGAQAAAEANVAAAQAALDQVRAGARAQEIQAQQEAVAAAQGGTDTAQAQLAQARGALKAAEAGRNQAAARFAQVKDGARAEVIEQALTQMQQAEAGVRQAQAEYDKISSRADVAAMPQSLALERATLALQAAQANYDALVKGATTPELDQARAGVDQALAGIIQASAAVSQTEAALTSATARTRAEQAKLELLQAGARPEQIKAAEAQVQAAQAQAEAARGRIVEVEAGLKVIDEQIARLTVRAPSDGVVLQRTIEPGEVAMPGGALLTLGDLANLTLTVYLPEDQYGAIKVGQGAQVTVDSFPGRVFTGVVQRIADRGEFTPRNVQTPAGRRAVVFAIKIAVDNPTGDLKLGMPADVVFE